MSGKDVPGQGGGEVKGGEVKGGGDVKGGGEVKGGEEVKGGGEVKGGAGVGGAGEGGARAGGGPGDPSKVSSCDCESVIKLVSTRIRAPLTLHTSHPKTNPSKAQLYVLQLSPLVSPAQCGGGEILRIQCVTLF